MTRSTSTFLLYGALVIPAVSCGTAAVGDPAERPPGIDAEMAQIMVDSYRNGQVPVATSVAVHAEPRVGQRADWGAFRWTVVAVTPQHVIVEHSFEGYALAYRVDPAKPRGEPNVLAAWVAKHGEPPEPLVPPKSQPTRNPHGPETRTTRERFEDLRVGDRSWNGTLIISTVTANDREFKAKTWRADDAWFDGTIKTESAGKVTEVRFTANNAPDLDWP